MTTKTFRQRHGRSVATGVVLAASLLVLAAPAPVRAAPPPPDKGWVTGVADTNAQARRLPCASEASDGGAAVLGGWERWGVAVCFPKRSERWYVDQLDSCALRSDASTGFRLWGTCVLTIDMGAYVKAWVPRGAVDEDFVLVWE